MYANSCLRKIISCPLAMYLAIALNFCALKMYISGDLKIDVTNGFKNVLFLVISVLHK